MNNQLPYPLEYCEFLPFGVYTVEKLQLESDFENIQVYFIFSSTIEITKLIEKFHYPDIYPTLKSLIK